MSEPVNKTPAGLTIHASEETQRGFYSNVARITHSPEEFVVDFVFIAADPPAGTLGARIILSPAHAKRLVAAIAENVNRFESRFGEIRVGPAPEIPGGEN